MTLVGSFLINDVPLLISDILLSAPDDSSSEVPTVENITDVFPKGSGYVPSRLQQKIAVISSNFVIGWAGRLFAAKAVIKELYEMNQKKSFTHNSLMLYFESLKKDNFNEGEQFAGFIKDSTGTNRFEFNSLDTQITSLGRVQLLGSGTSDLVELLTDMYSSPQPVAKLSDDLQLDVLLNSLTITGALLSTEIATHKSLLNYYGAGYEIVSTVNGKFGKFGDITYLFWYPIKMGNGFQMRLRHISKYTYIRDVLLIRAVRIFSPFPLGNPSKENPGHSGSLDAISPIYRDLEPGEAESFQMPLLNSGLFCNFFMVPGSPNKPYTAFTVIKAANKEGTISITEEGERLKVHIDHMWLNRVIERNLNYIKENQF